MVGGDSLEGDDGMKVVAMLGDVLESLVHRPVTRPYPFERHEPPPSLRGQLQWDPTNCIGCGLCVRDCPAKAIEIITVDKEDKRFVMRYHLDRCLFCSQCVQSCRRECLSMSSDSWELAAQSLEPFSLLYGDDADVEITHTALSKPDAGKPETS
jgi:NAD(P)H-quinone oxidoreductase subunit I/formate hydrogenlyase subunit 6